MSNYTSTYLLDRLRMASQRVQDIKDTVFTQSSPVLYAQKSLFAECDRMIAEIQDNNAKDGITHARTNILEPTCKYVYWRIVGVYPDPSNRELNTLDKIIKHPALQAKLTDLWPVGAFNLLNNAVNVKGYGNLAVHESGEVDYRFVQPTIDALTEFLNGICDFHNMSSLKNKADSKLLSFEMGINTGANPRYNGRPEIKAIFHGIPFCTINGKRMTYKICWFTTFGKQISSFPSKTLMDQDAGKSIECRVYWYEEVLSSSYRGKVEISEHPDVFSLFYKETVVITNEMLGLPSQSTTTTVQSSQEKHAQLEIKPFKTSDRYSLKAVYNGENTQEIDNRKMSVALAWFNISRNDRGRQIIARQRTTAMITLRKTDVGNVYQCRAFWVPIEDSITDQSVLSSYSEITRMNYGPITAEDVGLQSERKEPAIITVTPVTDTATDIVSNDNNAGSSEESSIAGEKKDESIITPDADLSVKTDREAVSERNKIDRELPLDASRKGMVPPMMDLFRPNMELMHYFIRPEDDFVLNTLEIVDAKEYLYRELKREGYRHILFVELDGIDRKVFAYDEASANAFTRTKGGKVGLPDGTIPDIASHRKHALATVSSPEQFLACFDTHIAPMLKDRQHKAALILPLSMQTIPDYFTYDLLRLIKGIRAVRGRKSSIIFTLQTGSELLPCCRDGFFRQFHGLWAENAHNEIVGRNCKPSEAIRICLAQLERNVVVADGMEIDEVSNLLLRKLIVEKQNLYGLLPSRLYSAATAIVEQCTSPHGMQLFKHLHPGEMYSHYCIRSLEDDLETNPAFVKELAEYAAKAEPMQIVYYDNLHPLMLNRVFHLNLARCQGPSVGFTSKYIRVPQKLFDMLPTAYDCSGFSRTEIQAITDKAVLFIRTYSDRGTILDSGTGFIIHPDGYALTCSHVVRGASKIEARLRIAGLTGGSDRWCTCSVVNAKDPLDMALIKLDGSDFPYLAIADEKREVLDGEEYLLSGYPFATQDAISHFYGTVASSDKQKDEAGYEHRFINGFAHSGSSGAPLISLNDGCVIGILVGADVRSKMPGIHEMLNYMRPTKYFWKEFTKPKTGSARTDTAIRSQQVAQTRLSASAGQSSMQGDAISKKHSQSSSQRSQLTIATYQDLVACGLDALSISRRLVENDAKLYPDIELANAGTPEQWAEYLSTYPETFRYLIDSNNTIVGNWSFLGVSEELHMEKLAKGELAEESFRVEDTSYIRFPGDYIGYLLNFSVNEGYNEDPNNNMMLFEEFIRQLLSFAEKGIYFKEWYVNVFRKDHESMYKQMGFSYYMKNKHSGKLFMLKCTPFPPRSPFGNNKKLMEAYDEHFQI